jgi:hypothetical protein
MKRIYDYSCIFRRKGEQIKKAIRQLTDGFFDLLPFSTKDAAIIVNSFHVSIYLNAGHDDFGKEI